MKLEPGKYYKTRDGRKAFVGFEIESRQQFVGELSDSINSWAVSGLIWDYPHASPGDLIEEWREPEVYEFECEWKKIIGSDIIYPDYPLMNNSDLKGKRTKVRVEVID